MFRLFFSFLTVGLAALLMAGCVQKMHSVQEIGQMMPEERAHIMLQQPQVDDIYSAEVSKFSEYFDGDAFGLMRVIEVNADSIVVITEDAAWPDEADGSVEELAGDFSTIGWDFEEKIVLQRANLEGYLKDGSIVATRRLTPEEIKAFLGDN